MWAKLSVTLGIGSLPWISYSGVEPAGVLDVDRGFDDFADRNCRPSATIGRDRSCLPAGCILR
jgi:hypothetical protein